LPMNHVRNADAGRLSETLQPRGDIDALAINLIALDHHIAEIDADAELHPPLQRQFRILVPQRALNRNGAINRLDHTSEFGQNTIAGRVDQASAMVLDKAIYDFAIGRQSTQRRPFILTHETAIAVNVGAQDSGELTLRDSPLADRDTATAASAHTLSSPWL